MAVEYLTVAEAAEKLSISARTLHRWINEGEIPGYTVGQAKRLIRIKVSDVEALVKPIPNARS